MQNTAAETNHLDAEGIVWRIQRGDYHLRDILIKSNWNMILSIVVKMTGKPSDYSDEFSVALEAFNEAIDSYDPSRNKSFISFSGLVINRRVIDYIRKTGKYRSEFPFTVFESEDGEEGVESLAAEPAVFTVKIEIQEEILRFKETLRLYGITFDDLIRLSPKHRDTRVLCAAIAKKMVDNPLSVKLEREHRLPVGEIAQEFEISRKTVDKHRKYLIALYLVLKSDMDIIKSYVNTLEKGAD